MLPKEKKIKISTRTHTKIILGLFTFIMASGNIRALKWIHGRRASHLAGHDMDSTSTLINASLSKSLLLQL
jgi:hypothetical protein